MILIHCIHRCNSLIHLPLLRKESRVVKNVASNVKKLINRRTYIEFPIGLGFETDSEKLQMTLGQQSKLPKITIFLESRQESRFIS